MQMSLNVRCHYNRAEIIDDVASQSELVVFSRSCELKNLCCVGFCRPNACVRIFLGLFLFSFFMFFSCISPRFSRDICYHRSLAVLSILQYTIDKQKKPKINLPSERNSPDTFCWKEVATALSTKIKLKNMYYAKFERNVEYACE